MPERNDPCPCGSGKKNKKCHGVETEPDPSLKYERIRRLDGESSNLMTKFVKHMYGEDGFRRAWEEFWLSEDPPEEIEENDVDLFERWMLFNWRPDGERPLARVFLEERKAPLDAQMVRFIESTLAAPCSFLQTLDVRSGAGMRLRDLLREREFDVMERKASTTLRKAEIIYARVVEMDGICFMMGTGGTAISPDFISYLVNLRTRIKKKKLSLRGSKASEILLDLDDGLRETYFEMLESMRSRTLRLNNTDGDPLVFHTLRYDVQSFTAAFEALKDLELRLTDRDESALLQAGGPAGTSPSAVIHWLKRQRRRNQSQLVTTATLRLSGTTLVVEVNSRKRATRVQKEIEERLGDRAVHRGTDVMTQQQMEAGMEKREESETEGEERKRLNESPEVQEIMRKMLEQHWATWPDVPLPALGGKTPREAAKTPNGRELLESLLLEFESRNDARKSPMPPVDVEKLRRDLGLVHPGKKQGKAATKPLRH